MAAVHLGSAERNVHEDTKILISDCPSHAQRHADQRPGTLDSFRRRLPRDQSKATERQHERVAARLIRI